MFNVWILIFSNYNIMASKTDPRRSPPIQIPKSMIRSKSAPTTGRESPLPAGFRQVERRPEATFIPIGTGGDPQGLNPDAGGTDVDENTLSPNTKAKISVPFSRPKATGSRRSLSAELDRQRTRGLGFGY